jgi:drug/metabolite transporter (DMT)-like permease
VRLKPTLLALIAIFILSMMDAMIKHAAIDHGTLQIVLMRFAMGTLVVGILFGFLFPGWPSWHVIRINGLRGFLVVFTALTFFYGLSVLPLAGALALSFLSPIFVAGLGVLILKEKAGSNILAGLLLGTVGMVVMVLGLQTGTSTPRPLSGIIAAIVSAFSYGLAIVLLRARATRDPVITIVLIQHAVPALIAGLLALGVWVFATPGLDSVPQAIRFSPLTGEAWLWFLAVGLCGALGHVILATAFSKAEAASLAPLDYTSLIWAVIFGYLFFDEVPGLSTLLGAVLIAAGAFVTSAGSPAKPKLLGEV